MLQSPCSIAAHSGGVGCEVASRGLGCDVDVRGARPQFSIAASRMPGKGWQTTLKVVVGRGYVPVLPLSVILAYEGMLSYAFYQSQPGPGSMAESSVTRSSSC